ADEIEHQIDTADVFQSVVFEVDELLRPEIERFLAVGSASGADHIGAKFMGELGHHRADCAGRPVRDNALPCLKAAMLEQSLPRRQARDWQAGAHCEVNIARQGREVTRLDSDVLGQGAVTIPVCEAEHPLPHRETRRAIAQSSDHAGQFVSGNRRCPATLEAIGPGRGPCQLCRDETRRIHPNHNVVYRCLRFGPFRQLHPSRSRILVHRNDCLHRLSPRVVGRHRPNSIATTRFRNPWRFGRRRGRLLTGNWQFNGLAVAGLQADNARSVSQFVPTAMGLVCVGAGALMLVALFANPLANRLVDIKVKHPLAEAGLRLTGKLCRALADISRPMNILRLSILSLMVWGIEGLVLYCCGLALHMALPFSVTYFILASANLSGLLPGTPGNVGTFHYFAVLAATSFGVNADRAAALAILSHALMWVPITLCGLICLVASPIGFRKGVLMKSISARGEF